MLDSIRSLMVDAISTALIVGLGFLVNYVRGFVKSRQVQAAIDIMERTLENTVRGIEQTVVQELKGVDGDRKLTAEEKSMIKQTAVNSAKIQLGVGTKELLESAFGDLNEVLDKWIESAVNKMD